MCCVQIKRTEGVSSTDLVGRMLLCTRDSSRAVQQQVRGLQTLGWCVGLRRAGGH